LKILLHTDLTLRANELFWHRDLGLLTKAFRSLGHDAWLVVYPAFKIPSKIKNLKSTIAKDPIIWASPAEVRNPSWWQSQKPDLVILGLWTRPKYDPVRRAALSATPRVIERADSDGMRTASCGLPMYARRRYDYFRDRSYRWPAFLSMPASALYSFASILGTPWIEARLARTLKLLPAVAVETPLATQLWKKLAAKLGVDPKRIYCIPHPIQTDIFRKDPAIRRKNQILSVGRWESYQKNFPLLRQALLGFLDRNRGWTARVVGSGLPRSSAHPRLIFSAPLAPRGLARWMKESKIFLCSSQYESFGLAAMEAATCGCRVVAPRTCHLAAPSLQPRRGETLAKAMERGRTALASKISSPCPSPLDPIGIARQFLRISFPKNKRTSFGTGRSAREQGY
jgi:glycosyltransferase involved in cell wall biosynthesis